MNDLPPSFGTYLKMARELRGISREELSAATRIPIKRISDFEEDRLSQADEGIYMKSVIKAYVDYLGLNEDSIMLELQYQQAKTIFEENRKVSKPRYRTGRDYPFFLFIVTLLIIFLFFTFHGSDHGVVERTTRDDTGKNSRPATGRFTREKMKTVFSKINKLEISSDAMMKRPPDQIKTVSVGDYIRISTTSPVWIFLMYPAEGREVTELIFPGEGYKYMVSSRCRLSVEKTEPLYVVAGRDKLELAPRSPSVIEFIPEANEIIID